MHVNGFAGVDFAAADSAAFARAGEALLQTGVTAYQPTVITAPEPELAAAIAEAGAATHGPRFLGVHVEGPFLSPHQTGAHPPEARRDPDPELALRLLDAGPVSHVTLAPELPGALDLAALLRERGVSVSAGHSNATAEEAQEAFRSGIRTVTHLFNAMRPFRPRDPGIMGAALADPGVIVQVILDGHHFARESALMAWSCARGRLALVTDATAAAALGDGRFRLGGVEVTSRDGVVRRDDGVLAGSALTMLQAVRNLVELGASREEAILAASEVPARAMGRSDVGRLTPGGPADIVVLSDDLDVERVLVGGQERVAARA